MPAVPLIGLGISAYGAYKNAKAQGQAANAQNAALQGQLGGLRRAQGASQGVLDTAQPMLQQAGGYYQKLLSGNRAVMNQATAGTNAQITSTYRGAQAGLDRSMIRGGARDTASAELNRDRAAALAGVQTGVQPGAAQAMGQLGMQGTAMGLQGLVGASTGMNSAAGQYGQNAMMYGQNARDDMAGVGKSFGELLIEMQKRRGGTTGGGGTAPYGGGGFFGGGMV